MLHRIRAVLAERRRAAAERGEDGFTLIELMVVVLIIAILIAIAIPTFLGARQKAQDRAAQSNLRNALTAAKTAYVDSQSYASDIASTDYNSIEPSLNFVYGAAASGSGNKVAVASPVADTIILAAASPSGNCFYIKDVTGSVSTANPGTYFAKAPGTSCSPSGTIAFTATATDPANHW